MITVADIIALPAFKRVELIAPCKGGGSRPVHNVGILDCPPDINNYNAYFPGEFIVTNLGFAAGDKEASQAALLAMIARRPSAIAVKTVYDPIVSEQVRRASELSGVPVYIYEGAYHEMVAYQALDLIRNDEQEEDKSEAIDALLQPENDELIRDALFDITRTTGSAMRCIAVRPKNGDECSLHALMGNLSHTFNSMATNTDNVEAVRCFRYRDCLLVFVSYEESNPHVTDEGLDAPATEILRIIKSTGELLCGIGDEVALSEGDLSIRQALMLLQSADDKGLTSMMWGDLHVDAFFKAAAGDRLLALTCSTYLTRLKGDGSSKESDMLATAKTFVAHTGDVNTTAAALYQHPNTIRYRLRKIKALLGLSDASDRELLLFLNLVFLTSGDTLVADQR